MRYFPVQVAHFVTFVKEHASIPVTLDNPEYEVPVPRYSHSCDC
jgi:hypothetical protein